jgi:hypothetical protein
MKICAEILDSNEVRVVCEGNASLCNALRLVLNLLFTVLQSIDAITNMIAESESKTASTSDTQ